MTPGLKSGVAPNLIYKGIKNISGLLVQSSAEGPRAQPVISHPPALSLDVDEETKRERRVPSSSPPPRAPHWGGPHRQGPGCPLERCGSEQLAGTCSGGGAVGSCLSVAMVTAGVVEPPDLVSAWAAWTGFFSLSQLCFLEQSGPRHSYPPRPESPCSPCTCQLTPHPPRSRVWIPHRGPDFLLPAP